MDDRSTEVSNGTYRALLRTQVGRFSIPLLSLR